MVSPCKHGSEKLIAAFGEWPTVYDAEVILLFLERAFPIKDGYHIAQIVILLRQFGSIKIPTSKYNI
jgi:hypothetical protein